ncbi:MAG: hypothetical protein JWN27_3597, partial [Candidatus Eremiobacteraeota bacterium]|nr:hypothetical protein [Candidatus Eremiobacteraeota bacterium]
ADATAELRGRSLATDGDVERWRVIPDRFDEQRNEPIVYDTVLVPPLNAEQTRNVFHGADRWIANAAYLNVAAREGRAWITTPRTSNVAVGGGSGSGTRWTRPSLGTDHYPTGSEEVTRQGS